MSSTPADHVALYAWLQDDKGPQDAFVIKLDEQVKTEKGQTVRDEDKYKPSQLSKVAVGGS